MNLKQLISLIVVVALAVTLVTFAVKSRQTIGRDSIELSSQGTKETTTGEDRVESATIVAFGDNLIHNVIYRQAYTGSGYNFEPLYKNIESIVKGADIAVINQETVMVGSAAPQSYPMFNTPTEMAGCLAKVGFDVCSVATNHCLDMMSSGLIDSLELLEKTDGITPVGAYHGRDEYDKFPVITVNDIKIAFLCFVEHTNGISLPEDKEDYLIYWSETDDVKYQINKARNTADVVVVCMHGGTEYSDSENDIQRDFVKLCVDNGADCIIGTHPHTLQPVEMMKSADGRDVPVLYSLGNLVSAQDTSFKRMTGGIATLKFTKDFSTGKVTASKPVMDISVTHYGPGFSNISIYTLSQYNDALARAHGIADMSIRNLYNHVQTVIGDEYLKEEYRSDKVNYQNQ